MIDLEAIRRRANAARPGPWMWRGNTEMQQCTLCTVHGGMIYVMTFDRWGMQSARPTFNSGRGLLSIGKPPKNWDETDPGQYRTRVVYDVCPEALTEADPRVYRQDFSAIDHPDAEFIAHSRQDVDDLLAEVDRLRAALGAAGIEVARD